MRDGEITALRGGEGCDDGILEDEAGAHDVFQREAVRCHLKPKQGGQAAGGRGDDDRARLGS